MTKPFDFQRLLKQHEQRRNTRPGLPTQADYDRLPYVLHFDGLCADELGYHRFQQLYCFINLFAAQVTDNDFIMQAVHDPLTGARTGYCVYVANQGLAEEVAALCPALMGL